MHLKKRRALLKRAKGYRWSRRKTMRHAKTAVMKAGVHAYRDRRDKKAVRRALWQVRLNAAVRPFGLSYSRFIDRLKKNNIELDRKVLSALAIDHPQVFAKLVEKVK
jgi:large subunit ribosomal protein L20